MQEEHRLEAELAARQVRMATLLERGLAGPLWNLDRATVEELMTALMADPEVFSVEVHGQGLRGGQLMRVRSGAAPRTLRREFEIRYEPAPQAAQEVIGRGVIVHTRALLEAQLADTRRLVGELLAAVLLGVLTCSVLLVQVLVRRPVARLAQLAQRMAQGDLGSQLPVRSNDEIGELTQQFNAMSLALKRTDEQLRASQAEQRDRLEALVVVRTAELRDASARAEAAAHSKGRFLATMSHELRTPLNGIPGFVQLLQMDPSLSAQHQDRLRVMRDSGEHLLSLIEDVLDMASIEAGKVILKPASIDLRALLDIVVHSLRPRADAKRLDLQLSVDPALPVRLLLDGQRLRQVLLNLLSNAVKFTDAGHVRLAVQVHGQDDRVWRIEFVVSDSGVGLAPEQQARLFKPFEQVGDTQRRHGGTGLGLSISQELVRLMGGQISVHSEAGWGSEFSFEIACPQSA